MYDKRIKHASKQPQQEAWVWFPDQDGSLRVSLIFLQTGVSCLVQAGQLQLKYKLQLENENKVQDLRG